MNCRGGGRNELPSVWYLINQVCFGGVVVVVEGEEDAMNCGPYGR